MLTAGAGAVGVWLVVGLGNPGLRYRETRHNLGYLVLDRVAHEQGAVWRRQGDSLVASLALAGRALTLAKPQTFMNRSGLAMPALLGQPGVEIGRVLVVHDDLDLPFGRLRIRERGGHAGHNGVRSLLEVLGSERFVRLKMGIGRPAPGEEVVDHVLSRFTREEECALPAFLDRAADAVESVVVEGPVRAMNRFPS